MINPEGMPVEKASALRHRSKTVPGVIKAA